MVQRLHEGPLGHCDALVGGTAHPYTDNPGRARTAPGVEDGVYDELLHTLHPVGGIEHPEFGHVLGTGAFQHHGYLREVVIGRDVMDARHAVPQVVAVVLPGERVHGVGPHGYVPGTVLDRLRYVLGDGGVELPADVEYRYPGILAHRLPQMLGLPDVVQYRPDLGICRFIGLPFGGGL